MLRGALTAKPNAFRARSWEMARTKFLDLHDSWGSNTVLYTRGKTPIRVLPQENAFLNYNLITDSVRMSLDAVRMNRFMAPELGTVNPLDYYMDYFPISINLATRLYNLICSRSEKLHSVIGPFSSLEHSINLVNFLAQTNTTATHLILNPHSEVVDFDVLSSLLYHDSVSNLENFDTIFLVGTNLNAEMPILYNKLLQIMKKDSTKNLITIASLFPSSDAIINLGNDLAVLQKLLLGKHKACKFLLQSDKVLFILGQSILKVEGVLNLVKDLMTHLNLDLDTHVNNFSSLQEGITKIEIIATWYDPTVINNYLLVGYLNKSLNQLLVKAPTEQTNTLLLYNVDDCDWDDEFYTYKIYFGSHGDYSSERVDLIMPIPALLEESGAFFNFQGLLQSNPWTVARPIKGRNFLSLYYAIKLKLQLMTDNFLFHNLLYFNRQSTLNLKLMQQTQIMLPVLLPISQISLPISNYFNTIFSIIFREVDLELINLDNYLTNVENGLSEFNYNLLTLIFTENHFFSTLFNSKREQKIMKKILLLRDSVSFETTISFINLAMSLSPNYHKLFRANSFVRNSVILALAASRFSEEKPKFNSTII